VARIRLLLAEDHLEMRKMILRILEREFDVVGAVGDGQALLEAEPRLKPDVCVIDISMPILSGIEAAILLRQSGSLVKIVFLTVHTQDVFVEAALEAGALGYVLKPRMASDLHLAVQEAFSGRSFVSPSLSPTNAGGKNGHTT